jgi:predicted membrane protein
VLSVSTGAGEAKLDLSQLNLERLKVKTSVGSTQLYLPRRGRLSATVDTGVGELDIIIPTGMAARIRVDRGLGSIEVRNKDYRQEEDVYVSADFEGAADRVDLAIDAGIGKITVR